MELEEFQTNFSEIGNQKYLRCDTKYRYFWDIQKGKTFSTDLVKYPLTPLKNVLKPHKTKILKDGGLDKEYILVELNDIEPGSGEVVRERTVYEINSDKVLFDDADILMSKLTPEKGHYILNDRTKPYIGTTELMPFKINSEYSIPIFLKYLLLSIREKFSLLTSGKTHPRIQTIDLLNIKVPKLPLSRQREIINQTNESEIKIKKLKKQLKSLQEIIDEIFVKFKIKSIGERERNEFEVFQTDLNNISCQKFLRNGPLYRLFWDVHNGLLFSQNKSKYPLAKLGELIKLHKTKTLKKGILDQEYTLLDLEDIESMTGRILSEDKLVTEIGSDKTLFGDSDIIISKIDPYLGYTFLNDESKPYIGTTELLPFKVNKEKALPEFIKYLLLSRDYIEKSLLLMYGKRHPRIYILDLLNIRVPCPDLSIQKKIVEEISEAEERNFQAQERIKRLRKDIEDFLWNSLSER